MFAHNIWMIFFAQIIYGVGNGLSYPTWVGIWTEHLDKGKETFEWSVYSTTIGLGTAISATIGAAIADFIGFYYTFMLVTFLSILGLLILFFHTQKFKTQKKS